MDRETAFRCGREYARRIKEVYPNCRVILYGSYANGNYTENSDLDIAVIFDGFSDNWLSVSKFLWKTTRKVSSIIEPVLLDASKDVNGFYNHVITQGIML